MTKDFYNKVYHAEHTSKYGGTSEGMPNRTPILRDKTNKWLEHAGLANCPDALVLEIGCGMAYLSDIHPGWHGAEYSKTAVERVKEQKGPHVRIFEADAQDLPFENDQFDGIFTWAALEHVPDPNKAFQEIDRVLRGGGYALIAPAWNCRSWTTKKLEDRSYRELRLAERVEKTMIPLLELFWVRALVALPKRLLGEVRMYFRKPIALRFKQLSPRWDLIEKFGHVSDDDAVADIDPHAAVCFFKTREYEVLSHKTLFSRLLIRHEPVIVKKPKA